MTAAISIIWRSRSSRSSGCGSRSSSSNTIISAVMGEVYPKHSRIQEAKYKMQLIKF